LERGGETKGNQKKTLRVRKALQVKKEKKRDWVSKTGGGFFNKRSHTTTRGGELGRRLKNTVWKKKK